MEKFATYLFACPFIGHSPHARLISLSCLWFWCSDWQGGGGGGEKVLLLCLPWVDGWDGWPSLGETEGHSV